jgi:hypothetical protein
MLYNLYDIGKITIEGYAHDIRTGWSTSMLLFTLLKSTFHNLLVTYVQPSTCFKPHNPIP